MCTKIPAMHDELICHNWRSSARGSLLGNSAERTVNCDKFSHSDCVFFIKSKEKKCKYSEIIQAQGCIKECTGQYIYIYILCVQ